MRGSKAKQLRKHAYQGFENHGVTPKSRSYSNNMPKTSKVRSYYVRDVWTGKVYRKQEAIAEFIGKYGFEKFVSEFQNHYTYIDVAQPVVADMFRRSYQILKKEYTAGDEAWLEYFNRG